ncbi:MAG: hypothetical protein RLZZ301_1458 [Bacteroidota bacterium]|jgi:hypothetical protein
MKRKAVYIGVCFLVLGLAVVAYKSLTSAKTYSSKNPNAAYFYPLDTVPKVYLYRDMAGGLEEEFHRIYTVEDNEGPHLIVEVYASDGRLREAINYNIDSLSVQDHMVVNRFQEKEKATLYKNTLFPMALQTPTWFASKFSGVTDSTVFLFEIQRQFQQKKEAHFLEKEHDEALYFQDLVRLTAINPFTKKEQAKLDTRTSVFAKNIGLVAWYTADKSVHYRLEQILSQEEWIQIISR